MSEHHTVLAVWEVLCPDWGGIYELNWKHHQMFATLPLQGVQDGERADGSLGDEHGLQLHLHVLVCLHGDSCGGTILSLPLANTGISKYFWPKNITLSKSSGGWIWRNSWAIYWIQFHFPLGNNCFFLFFHQTVLGWKSYDKMKITSSNMNVSGPGYADSNDNWWFELLGLSVSFFALEALQHSYMIITLNYVCSFVAWAVCIAWVALSCMM